MLIAGICIALIFSLLLACGNVAYRCEHPYNTLFLGVFAAIVTVCHMVIANRMEWGIIFPIEGHGLLLVPYYLVILLWGATLGDILVMRKFPALAKKIFVAALGKGVKS